MAIFAILGLGLQIGGWGLPLSGGFPLLIDWYVLHQIVEGLHLFCFLNWVQEMTLVSSRMFLVHFYSDDQEVCLCRY
jgi:hypothetical protein